jgi:hypothetical protein
METKLKPNQGENGKCGFIDQTGKEVIPFQYDGTEEFINGWAEVIIDGHWDIIDRKNPNQQVNLEKFI